MMGRHRVNQTQLAKVLGLTQSGVSARLNGRVAFDTDDILRLATFFRAPLERLLPDPASVLADQGFRSSVCVTAGSEAKVLPWRPRITAAVAAARLAA